MPQHTHLLTPSTSYKSLLLSSASVPRSYLKCFNDSRRPLACDLVVTRQHAKYNDANDSLDVISRLLKIHERLPSQKQQPVGQQLKAE
jgi:hypothetical protein